MYVGAESTTSDAATPLVPGCPFDLGTGHPHLGAGRPRDLGTQGVIFCPGMSGISRRKISPRVPKWGKCQARSAVDGVSARSGRNF